MSGIAGLSLEEMSSAIAKGELGIVEATKATLAALEGAGRKVNAVARLEPEAALEQAKAAEKVAKTDRGPLHGVPLAHKDLYMRKGWRIEGGSRQLQGYVAPRTSHAVLRLDRAGAIDCGRLNTVEFGFGATGHNDYTGHPRNPWNPEHITGGSSSGSGAAVAAGAVVAALGSDTGGSVRAPAAACGVVGLKPTFGLVGRSGVLPMSASLDTVGPLTRTVRDCALFLQAIVGHDPDDAGSVSVPVPDYLAGIDTGARGVRLGLPSHYWLDEATPEIRASIEGVGKALGKLGLEAKPVRMEGVERANRLNTLITAVEATAAQGRWVAESIGKYNESSARRLMTGLFIPGEAYLRSIEFRRRFARDVLASTFREVDVVLAPMWPFAIPTIKESDPAGNPGFQAMVLAAGACARPVNYLGFPAISVPCGFTRNGLPAAFQLIGRPFEEALLLRVARAYEREHGNGQEGRRPKVWAG